MSLETLFTRYGQPSDEGRINITGYLQRPDKLKPNDIKGADNTAARCIAEMQQAIADLSEYRQALAARYADLSTAPYALRLELERYPATSYHGVSFEIRITKRYEDGTAITELRETYPGKERHAALVRFEALKKQRPGIEVWKDIERRSWER